MYVYPVSEKFKKHLSYGVEQHGDYLVVKANCFEDEDVQVEEILDRYEAKIIREVWQSKINYYLSYDYVPFSTELFIHIFYISGSPEYLYWLKGKVNDYFKNRKHLESCYLLLPELSTYTVVKKEIK